MTIKKKVNFVGIIKWITSQYLVFENRALPYPCKLGAYDNGKCFSYRDKFYAKVEFSGQLDVIEVEVSKIVESNLFEYFSPIDKKIIFDAFYNKEALKLTEIYFSHENQTEMLVFTSSVDACKKTLPINAVSNNNELIEKISKKDLIKISYISASSYFRNLFKGGKNADFSVNKH